MSLFDDIRADLASEYDALAQDIAADWKQLVADQSPPASRPGDAPRRKSGTLENSIEGQAETDGDGVSLTVGSDAPYAAMLENGTARMAARPSAGPTFEKWAETVLDRTAKAVEG